MYADLNCRGQISCLKVERCSLRPEAVRVAEHACFFTETDKTDGCIRSPHVRSLLSDKVVNSGPFPSSLAECVVSSTPAQEYGVSESRERCQQSTVDDHEQLWLGVPSARPKPGSTAVTHGPSRPQRHAGPAPMRPHASGSQADDVVAGCLLMSSPVSVVVSFSTVRRGPTYGPGTAMSQVRTVVAARGPTLADLESV
jgi:hypothetical protein